MATHITTAAAPAPVGPYSQGMVSNGLLFIAGQGPFSAEGERVGDTFEEQARLTFENLEAVANAAGTSLAHAVRMGVFIKDLDNFAALNAVAAEYLTEPYPARATIPVSLRGFDVEIDVVVEMPGE